MNLADLCLHQWRLSIAPLTNTWFPLGHFPQRYTHQPRPLCHQFTQIRLELFFSPSRDPSICLNQISSRCTSGIQVTWVHLPPRWDPMDRPWVFSQACGIIHLRVLPFLPSYRSAVIAVPSLAEADSTASRPECRLRSGLPYPPRPAAGTYHYRSDQ